MKGAFPMKVTVLVENTAPQHSGLTPEHGLSLYIQYRDHNILLDAGCSQAFAQNAKVLGVDLKQVDLAVLSHGHYDHADGLRYFLEENSTCKVYARPQAGGPYFSTSTGSPRFIGIHRDIWEGHPDRFDCGEGVRQPAPGIWLVPETVHGGPFASRETNLLRQEAAGGFVPDDFSHEHSLVLEGSRGLVLFNSCSHGGIVNIVRGVKEQLGRPVYAVFGGLHLFSAKAASGMNCTPEYALSVADALVSEGVEQIYTGHCTGQAALALLQDRLGERIQALTTGLCVTLE